MKTSSIVGIVILSLGMFLFTLFFGIYCWEFYLMTEGYVLTGENFVFAYGMLFLVAAVYVFIMISMICMIINLATIDKRSKKNGRR